MTDELQRPGMSAEGSAGPEGGRVAPAPRTEGSPSAKRGGSGAARRRRAGTSDVPSWRSGPMLLGYVLTGIVFGLFMAFALTDQCMSGSYGLSLCLPRWRALTGAPFNEIGDALAGFAGALAFVWLIVTVLIQGRELAAQREELEATREVQEEQLNAMKAQARVFQDEQKQRAEDRAEQELDAELANLVRRVSETDGMDALVDSAFMLDSCIDHRFEVGRYRDDPRPPFYREIEGDADFVYEMYRNLEHRFLTVATWQSSIDPNSIDLTHMLEIRGCVASALALEPSLSRAQRTRINTMRLQRIGQIIDELLAYFEEFWFEDPIEGNRNLDPTQ